MAIGRIPAEDIQQRPAALIIGILGLLLRFEQDRLVAGQGSKCLQQGIHGRGLEGGQWYAPEALHLAS